MSSTDEHVNYFKKESWEKIVGTVFDKQAKKYTRTARWTIHPDALRQLRIGNAKYKFTIDDLLRMDEEKRRRSA